ncbi:MAG: 3'(2'),5'-bisphosphate nucleotidase CysQ [Litoreibacter sp.]
MPENDLSLLIDAAYESGKIASTFFNAKPEVWDKDDNAGPVTEADLAIDRMLNSELLVNRPNYGWLSEETEDSTDRLSHEHVFIIDPIDGTRAFIAGEKHFSHSLAIAQNGQITAAAVYVPIMDLMFAASADTPATLNGVQIAPSPISTLDKATVLGAKVNFKDEYWEDGVPPIVRKFRPSLAYRLCLVAQGRYDAMITLRDCWEWDIAAGDLIARQAGAHVSDRSGAPLHFNNPHPKTPGCLAAGPNLHPLLYQRLKPRPN